MEIEQRIKEIIKRLKAKYPNAKTELNWDNNYPYQLVVAVILSAQATDAGVNKATPALFDKYKTPQDFASLNIKELDSYIKTINFHTTKAQRVINNAQALLAEYGGNLPKTIAELVKLPGIGRKSANVILQEVYGIGEGVVVDTHMSRVSYRLQLQPFPTQQHAEKIEQELNKVVPTKNYADFSRTMVLHGRYTCTAKRPKCSECPLNDICPSAFKIPGWK